jgi:adenylate cyclase
MRAIDPKALQFDKFSLDLARCTLRRGVDEVQLRPKAFDLLRYLAENAGRLVAKDELMRTIWPGVVVTDDSLVQCVMDVRDALGDTEQRIIRTVPRRGYLFVAEVSVGPALDGRTLARPVADPRQFPKPRWLATHALRHRLWAAAVLVIVALAVGIKLIDPNTSERAVTAGKPPAQRQTIAVLPLVSLPDGAGEDYFADGLTEDLISALGRFPDISVRSLSTVLPYKGKPRRPEEVGREMDVRYVVEGSVRRSVEHIRVSIQLTDTSRGTVLWSLRYDTESRDIFSIQDEITQRIAGSLAVRLSHLELAKAASKPASSLEAYDLVLRGRQLLSRVTRTANSQARSMFEKALVIDPDYVPAMVGLGLVDLNAVRFGWTADPLEALQRAERLGHKAVVLDESSPGPHALLGRVYIRRGDLDRALDEMKRAVSLNPSDPDSYAGLGNALLLLGAVDGAIEAIETAIQLQPEISTTNYFRLGMAYILAGRNTDAIRILERALVRNENNAFLNAMLAAAYAEAERGEDAIRRAKTVRELYPMFAAGDVGSLFRNPGHREKIQAALRKAGL